MLCNVLFYSALFSKLGKTRLQVFFITFTYTVDAFDTITLITFKILTLLPIIKLSPIFITIYYH